MHGNHQTLWQKCRAAKTLVPKTAEPINPLLPITKLKGSLLTTVMVDLLPVSHCGSNKNT